MLVPEFIISCLRSALYVLPASTMDTSHIGFSIIGPCALSSFINLIDKILNSRHIQSQRRIWMWVLFFSLSAFNEHLRLKWKLPKYLFMFNRYILPPIFLWISGVCYELAWVYLTPWNFWRFLFVRTKWGSRRASVAGTCFSFYCFSFFFFTLY